MEGLDNLTDFLMIDLEFCDKLISILEKGNWNTISFFITRMVIQQLREAFPFDSAPKYIRIIGL
jgi:rRNA-processing protein FCF1